MIAYKVVDGKTRHGSNWAINFYERNYDGKYFVEQYPEFFPIYLKNTTVKKAPNTVGILCFKTKEHAEAYIYNLFYNKNMIIIKVKGSFPKSWKNIRLNTMCGAYFENLILCGKQMFAPAGTIAFNSVEVLT